MLRFPLLFILALTFCACAAAQNFDKQKLVVFIKCPNGSGSGVLISSKGVLTAKHVVLGQDENGNVRQVSKSDFDKIECLGAIGSGQVPHLKLLPRREGLGIDYDAVVLEFTHHQSKDYARYAPITNEADSAVTGYGISNPKTAVVQSWPGKILETTIMSDGTFAVSAKSSPGMSGGPVVLDRNGALLGIIMGYRPGLDGNAADYRVLAAQRVARALELEPFVERQADNQRPRSNPCIPKGFPGHPIPYGGMKAILATCKGLAGDQEYEVSVELFNVCASDSRYSPSVSLEIEPSIQAAMPPRNTKVLGREACGNVSRLSTKGRAASNGWAEAEIRVYCRTRPVPVRDRDLVACTFEGVRWSIVPVS